jgi:hypothetical protein
MEPLQEIEKNIFNCHLATTRSAMGKPFKLRKKFDNLTDSALFYLRRLRIFFTKFPEIDMREYFRAPYEMYKDVPYYDLEYFASPKAVKAYSLYKKQEHLQDLDQQMESVKSGLGFMANFCLENNLTWQQYTTGDQDLPLWAIHVKEGHVPPVALFAISNLAEKLQNLGSELTELYLGDFGLDIYNQKLRYLKSTKIKSYIEKILPKIKHLLDKNQK